MKILSYITILATFLIILNVTIISGQNITFKNNSEFTIRNDIHRYSTIIIPDDYPTIQQGINNANPYDKLYVRSGIYNENIVIDKVGITLQGEKKYNTVIKGDKIKDAGIEIYAENVTIKDFTIKDFIKEENMYLDQAGIRVYSSNAIIKDNIFSNNEVGLEIYTKAYNITITDNEFIDDGIDLGNYMHSKNFSSLTEKDFIHNINNNTVNGRPLFYNLNKNDFEVPGEVGQILLFNCSNVTIKDIYMCRNDFPIILAYCNGCLLENITIEDARGETLFFRSNNNIVQNCKISNIFKGICLEIESRDNIIRYNEFSNNFVGISSFNSANNNSFYKNIVRNNQYYGIEIVSYHGGCQQDNIIRENELYNNRFGIVFRGKSIKNKIQNNTIKKSIIGVLLENNSDGNIIENNNFKLNLIPSFFRQCNNNYYNHNYWNRGRILPKIIIGLGSETKRFNPCINIDKNPAIKPNIF